MKKHVLLCLLLAGCKSDAPAGPPPNQEMPPADVGVFTVSVEQVTLQTELAGRTVAALTADLRPQVTGILKARKFEEGALVKTGQVLYQIDPAMYRAAYDSAAADLASAKANLAAAKIRNDRLAEISKAGGVSKQEADDAKAAFDLATAGLAQKSAALQAARINLDYTSIRAPITGRIGKSAVTAGALVTAGQIEPLSTIRSLDPMFVDLTDSSENRLRLRARLGAGTLLAGTTKVKLQLGDGSIYAHEGELEFAEVAVDQATGTVTLRAKFPNPDDTLLPGMYVRAVLDQAIDQAAMLVPQQGVTHDAKGEPTAMVVGAGNKVEVRTLKVDRVVGDRWLVTAGLKAGDQVIVEGLNKIGPGMPVKPSPVVPGAKPPEGAAGAGSAAGSGSAAVAPTPTTPEAAAPPVGSGSAAAAGSGSGSGSGSAAAARP